MWWSGDVIVMGWGPRWLRRGLSHIPNVPGSGLLTEPAGWAMRLGTDAVRLGTDAVRLGTDAVRLGTDAVRLGTGSVRHGAEAARAGTGVARQGSQLAWQTTQLAWQAAWLVTTPVRQTASALVALPGLADELAGPTRRVWTYTDRVHVRLRGSYGPAAHRQRAAIERTLEAHPGVRWARVNHALGRVIVELADPPAEVGEIVALLEVLDAPKEPADEGGDGGRAEAADDDYVEKTEGRPPLGLMLAADASGLAVTAAEWLFRRTPVPAEVAGVISFVDSIPRVRALAERAIPGHSAGTWFPMVSALVQTLAPGGTGLVLDAVQRLGQLREARATTAAWARAEHALTGTPERAAAEPAAVERPCPLPPGPAELGARLARQDVIVSDRRALRRLDRIDTVLLDADALQSGRYTIGDVLVTGGADRRADRGTGDGVDHDADHEEVATRLYALFDPERPRRVTDVDGWTLGPIEEVRVPGRTAKREANRLAGDATDHVLVLTFEQRLRAVVSVVRQQAPEVNALVTAVRR